MLVRAAEAPGAGVGVGVYLRTPGPLLAPGRWSEDQQVTKKWPHSRDLRILTLKMQQPNFTGIETKSREGHQLTPIHNESETRPEFRNWSLNFTTHFLAHSTKLKDTSEDELMNHDHTVV